MALALAAETQLMWWITLGLGAVVAAVVVVLLHLLLRAVVQIEDNVNTLWSTATRVARNTATGWQLGSTATELDALRSEVSHHDAVLSTDGPAQRPVNRTEGGS